MMGVPEKVKIPNQRIVLVIMEFGKGIHTVLSFVLDLCPM